MPVARVINYEGDHQTNLPVSGNGTALVKGALLKKGSTSSTDNGHLRLHTGTTGNKPLAILQEAHSTANDTDIPGTIFTTHPCDLILPGRVLRMEFSQATADLIAVASNAGTTLTITSLEANIETAFFYVVSGTGAGQLQYFTASASGSGTIKAAFATPLDATSKVIKIVPRLHELISITADGTKLSSQAAAGGIRAVILDLLLVRNNRETSINPVSDPGLTNLNGITSLRFEADLILVDSLVYQVT